MPSAFLVARQGMQPWGHYMQILRCTFRPRVGQPQPFTSGARTLLTTRSVHQSNQGNNGAGDALPWLRRPKPAPKPTPIPAPRLAPVPIRPAAFPSRPPPSSRQRYPMPPPPPPSSSARPSVLPRVNHVHRNMPNVQQSFRSPPNAAQSPRPQHPWQVKSHDTLPQTRPPAAPYYRPRPRWGAPEQSPGYTLPQVLSPSPSYPRPQPNPRGPQQRPRYPSVNPNQMPTNSWARPGHMANNRSGTSARMPFGRRPSAAPTPGIPSSNAPAVHGDLKESKVSEPTGRDKPIDTTTTRSVDKKIPKDAAIRKYVPGDDGPGTRRKEKEKISSGGRRRADTDLELATNGDALEPGRSGPRKRRLKKVVVKDVAVPIAIAVSDLANLIHRDMSQVLRIMELLEIGKPVHDYVLTPEETTMILLELNINPIQPDQTPAVDATPRDLPEDMSAYPLRPPIVTIMGHVDHGKTTLLDYLRKSAIAAGEAGGITQHIGAFSVSLANSDQPVTFLDTPGHAAFSNMRSRGAHMTDIVVLVVAADDGVMPQTIEAIKHAQDADVPIIVAVNKCDKPQANPNRIKEMLLKHSVQVEDFGGDIQAVEISALKGDNVDALIENILTLAEVLDLRAPTDGPAEARVVESQSEKGRGMTASVLVKNGTLKVGDIIVAGTTWGKVKSMTSDLGKPVKEAGPGDPVKVAGWKELPNAGDLALQVETEALAKEIIANRAQRVKQQKALQDIRVINEKRIQHNEETQEHNAERKQYAREVYRYYRGLRKDYPLEEQYLTKPSVPDPAEVAHKQQYRGPPTLRFVVKGDVSGTITAVVDALLALPQKKVRLEVVSHGVGAIVESDIQMAKSCEAMVIGFNVKADRTVQRVAKYLKVPVETHRVIYHLIDAVKQRMLDTMEPEYDTKVIGEANIQRVFTLDLKHGQHQRVAGCRVASGSIRHNHEVQVVRSDKVLYRGKLGSLKSGKHNTSEVTKGVECGISFADFDGFEEGDQIVSIEHIERPRKLA